MAHFPPEQKRITRVEEIGASQQSKVVKIIKMYDFVAEGAGMGNTKPRTFLKTANFFDRVTLEQA